MYWRLPQGGKLWEEQKGEKNKRAFKRLVTSGRVFGCLAFAGDEPIGWCCVGPRRDFPRLKRVKALQTEWGTGTWSVVCFYIRAGSRHRGVAAALLAQAVEVAKDNGAEELEGYPVRPSATGSGEIPAAFAWTGVPRLFQKQKFVRLNRPCTSRDVVRRTFESSE